MKTPSSSITQLFRPEVTERHGYSLTPYPNLIKLNQNELPYDFTPTMKRELWRSFQTLPLQQYPTTQPERLRQQLAKFLGVQPDQVLVSNGSNVMIQMLVLSLAVKGKVMAVDPTFSLFEAEATLLGNRYVGVPLENPGFCFPLQKFLKKLKQARPNLVIIANPNAPTGNLFPQDEILEVIRQAQCPVIVDEAYYQFSKQTVLPEIKKYPQLAVLRTFSKGFGMGGVRVGYLVARPEFIREVEKVILPYCVSRLSEATALVALRHRRHFEKIIAEVLQERERVFAAMQAMEHVEAFPSVANFILFRVKDSQKCFQHLLKQGVLVRDMSKPPYLKNCLRVSIGRPSENDAFLRVLNTTRL